MGPRIPGNPAHDAVTSSADDKAGLQDIVIVSLGRKFAFATPGLSKFASFGS